MKQTKNAATSVAVLCAVVCMSFVFGFGMSMLFTEQVAAATFDEESALLWKNNANDTGQSGTLLGYAPMSSFGDVDTTDWFYVAADYCVQNKLIAGYEDGNFYPDAQISRGMFTVVLWSMEGYPLIDYAPPYSDVPQGHWCRTAISWATATGIMDGCGDGTFRADELISREQLATIAWRYLKYKGIIPEDNRAALDPYKDADLISAYAQEAMRWAVSSGVMSADGNVELKPKDAVSRASLSVFLKRYITMHDLPLPPDLSTGHVLTSLIVSELPKKMEYATGEVFDRVGMVVTAIYSDGMRVDVTDYYVSTAPLSTDSRVVTIGYKGVTTQLDVTVDGVSNANPDGKAATKDGEAVKDAAKNTEKGSTNSSGSSESSYSWTGGGSSSGSSSSGGSGSGQSGGGTGGGSGTGGAGTGGGTAAHTLTGISVTTLPAKTAYNDGEAFDKAGMVVTASYSDGTTETIDDYTVTPSAMSHETTNVVISWNGFGDTVAVAVDCVAVAGVPSQSNTLTANGSAQSPTWDNYDENKMDLAGSTSETAPGTYPVTFTPKAGYKWPDNTIGAKVVEWTISKAAPSKPTFDKSSITFNKTVGVDTVTVTRDGDGLISAVSSNTDVATVSVDGTTVTVTNVTTERHGTATITVTVAEGTDYAAYTALDATVSVTADFSSLASAAIGEVVVAGSFKRHSDSMGDVYMAPASRPYNSGYDSPYADKRLDGDGNLPVYNSAYTYSFGDSLADSSINLRWVRVSNSLYVCDRHIMGNISNNIIKDMGFLTGSTTVEIEGHTYKIRLLTSAEWDEYVLTTEGGSNELFHWDGIYTCCSDRFNTSTASDYYYTIYRGNSSAAASYSTFGGGSANVSAVSSSFGFRPALELVE